MEYENDSGDKGKTVGFTNPKGQDFPAGIMDFADNHLRGPLHKKTVTRK
ncbi:hypothetical protein [Beduinella massiliensis]